jgi:hypothetical protein
VNKTTIVFASIETLPLLRFPNMHFLLLTTLLPAAMAAALKGRQSSSNSAFDNWSSPDMTYDGDRILGSFSSSSSGNSDSPGITKTDYTSSSSSGSTLNVTVQNLISSLSIKEIFVAVHSDNVHLFELGKPVSKEISSFASDGSNSFSSLSSNSIYGTVLTNSGSGSRNLAPGQYLNFSLPITFPSNNNNNDDNGNDSLADKLDDYDSSMSIIGRLDGLNDVFIGVDGSDLGDRRESFTASVYTFESGFLTVHSGYVNSSITFASRTAAQILTFA